jgi:hypothetical protein
MVALCTTTLSQARYQLIVQQSVEQIPYHPHIPAYKTAKTSYPYITGYTLRSLCDFILDSVTNNLIPENVEAGDILFVSHHFIEKFFLEYYPKIDCHFILLTHHYFDNGDVSTPGPYTNYLEAEKLLAWFTVNADSIHPKVKPLPLGIANSYYPAGNTKLLTEQIKASKKIAKEKLLYSNFSPNTEERLAVYEQFNNKEFCSTTAGKTQAEYLTEMAQHKFVLSPPGAGIDCYRTWEALFLGSIPIIKHSTLDALFENLPVLIINDWSEITEELLERKYKELIARKGEYNYAKLYMPYWINELLTYKFNAKLSM